MSTKKKTTEKTDQQPQIIIEPDRTLVGEGFGARLPIDSEFGSETNVVGFINGVRLLIQIKVESAFQKPNSHPQRRSVKVVAEHFPINRHG